MTLFDRVFTCSCGYTQNRDIHSARNMLLFTRGRELTSLIVEE